MDDPRSEIRYAVRHSLVRKGPPARPVKARATTVTPGMVPDEAFRAALSGCLAQITANAAALRAGRSVEGLHQLRVALRRLEVALGAFSKEFSQDWLEELRGRAKILSARVGPARELDVFCGTLLNGLRQADGEGLAHLRVRAEAAREQAWHDTAACIAGADFALFIDDVAALAGSRLPLGHARKLPRTAARMLDRQAARVKKRGRQARSRDEADLHRLRIALKKLRYTAEFFAPLYQDDKVRRYLKEVRALQDRLGELNDAANVKSVLALLFGTDDRRNSNEDAVRYAGGQLAGWHLAESARAAKQTLKRYDRFRGIRPFWR